MTLIIHHTRNILLHMHNFAILLYDITKAAAVNLGICSCIFFQSITKVIKIAKIVIGKKIILKKTVL